MRQLRVIFGAHKEYERFSLKKTTACMKPVIFRHSFNTVQQGLSLLENALIPNSTLIKSSGCKQRYCSASYPSENVQGQENPAEPFALPASIGTTKALPQPSHEPQPLNQGLYSLQIPPSSLQAM